MEALGGWLSLPAVCRLLGWGYSKAYAAAIAGEMGAKQLDGRWWFRRAAVLRRVAARETKAAPSAQP